MTPGESTTGSSDLHPLFVRMKGVDATEQAEGCVVRSKRFCDSVVVRKERCFTLTYIYMIYM